MLPGVPLALHKGFKGGVLCQMTRPVRGAVLHAKWKQQLASLLLMSSEAGRCKLSFVCSWGAMAAVYGHGAIEYARDVHQSALI